MPDVSGKTTTRVIGGKASRGPTVRTDGFPSCDDLVDRRRRRHCRARHGEDGPLEEAARASTPTTSRALGPRREPAGKTEASSGRASAYTSRNASSSST